MQPAGRVEMTVSMAKYLLPEVAAKMDTFISSRTLALVAWDLATGVLRFCARPLTVDRKTIKN
jgi:hypothetical protein